MISEGGEWRNTRHDAETTGHLSPVQEECGRKSRACYVHHEHGVCGVGSFERSLQQDKGILHGFRFCTQYSTCFVTATHSVPHQDSPNSCCVFLISHDAFPMPLTSTVVITLLLYFQYPFPPYIGGT